MVQGGDKQPKRIGLAPPYLTLWGHRVPIDIPLLIIGFILTFFTKQTATYLQLQVDLNALKAFGQILLLVGAIFLIFGRIELKR